MSSDLHPPSPRPLQYFLYIAVLPLYLPDHPSVSFLLFLILMDHSFAVYTSFHSMPALLLLQTVKAIYTCLFLLLPAHADTMTRKPVLYLFRQVIVCTQRQVLPPNSVRHSVRSLPVPPPFSHAVHKTEMINQFLSFFFSSCLLLDRC